MLKQVTEPNPNTMNQQIDTATKQKVEVMQKVSVGVIMVAVLCLGVALIIKLFFTKDNTLTSTLAASPKYAVPVDTAEFRRTFSIPTEDTTERLNINKAVTENVEIPLDIGSNIIGLSIDGAVVLDEIKSYARVVLVDKLGNEFLVYQAAFPFEEINELQGACEETCLMDSIIPSYLRVELSHKNSKSEGQKTNGTSEPAASMSIFLVTYLKKGKSVVAGVTATNIRESQRSFTITSLNNKGRYWTAGETSFSNLTYSQKKKYFGGDFSNLCGLEYYKGGYFEFCKRSSYFPVGSLNTAEEIPPDEPSPPAFVFDWRNRHGQNWMTSVKDQAGCGSCWAFSAVGAVEGAINLYFNQHIDPDLSEQQVVSCDPYSFGCAGGWPGSALRYISATGIVDEECFPYSASDEDCANMCSDWQSRAWRKNGGSTVASRYLPVKEAVTTHGPLAMAVMGRSHAVVLTGFGELAVGDRGLPPDDPLIGTTYWIVKNSWGTDWGENGYGKWIFSPGELGEEVEFDTAGSSFIPPSNFQYSKNCTDNDSDGFCSWGIGAKPQEGCPPCTEQPDCNDSNSTIQACPEHFVCGSHPWLSSAEVGGSFGDGYTGYGSFSCCGDSLGEHEVSGRCCNDRLKVLKQEDIYVFSFGWGTRGSDNGQFWVPIGVSIEGDQMFVTDSANNRVQVFNLQSNYLRQWTVSGAEPGQPSSPQGIEVAGDQVFVVADNKVNVFDLQGNYLYRWGEWGEEEGQFQNAQGIAIADDRVYIADSDNDRIQVFDLTGNYLFQWGSHGSGDGQFIVVPDIAIRNGEVYVVDYFNNRVQVFDMQGTYLRQWGAGTGFLSSPQGIAADDSRVYVTDMSNHVSVFDHLGDFVTQWGSQGSGGGQLNWPREIAIDEADNRVYIADSNNDRVQTFVVGVGDVCRFDPAEVEILAGLFNPPTEVVENYVTVPMRSMIYFSGSATDYGQPDGTCINCQYAWFLDSQLVSETDSFSTVFDEQTKIGDHELKLVATDAEGDDNEKVIRIVVGFVSQMGREGSGEGEFNTPSRIAFSQEGEYYYVVDSLNNRIEKFSRDGNFILSWGTLGSNQGEFQSPFALAVLSNRVFVIDTYNHRVQVFDESGDYQYEWGSYGTGQGQFIYPYGIAIRNGTVYITDTNNNRIQIFSGNGEFLDEWLMSWSARPVDIAFSDERAYVVDNGVNLVRVLDANNGAELFTWGEEGSTDGQFRSPFGIAIDRSNVYVADTNNHRIQVFDTEGQLQYKWGRWGDEPGMFKSPTGVTVANNHIYVVDRMNHRLQIFGPLFRVCEDDTPYGECNSARFYCQEGVLLPDCLRCGCPNETPRCNESTLRCEIICGDINGDTAVTKSDVDFLVSYLKGGPAPSPLQKADVNGDNKVNGSDVTYLVNYLKGGPALRCPNPQ